MREKMAFVSLVGTQIMGTLQPWLAFFKEYGPCPAYLLPTARTKPVAERLEAFAAEKGMGEVIILDVSSNLNATDSALANLELLAPEAQANDTRLCFNLDGGMNYMICACLLALAPYEPLLIQAGRERIVIEDTKTGETKVLRMPDPFSCEALLELQGVPYKLDKKWKKNKFFNSFKLPPRCIENIEIGGIAFDLAWNPGNNRFCFVKDCRWFNKDNKRELERDFAHWSTDRDRCGQIYDKSVYALTDDANSEERLRKESGLQIEVCDFSEAGARSERMGALQKWFDKSYRQNKGRILRPEKAKQDKMRDNTLVVCVGKNLVSTIAAICSHKPDHLVLCAAMNDKDGIVASYATNIAKFKHKLGLESVSVINFGREGLYAEELLPEAESDACDIHVNISPGTKAQGGGLARWAKKHGFRIWSLDKARQRCATIGAEADQLPLKLCDPALCFQLMGVDLLSCGLAQEDLAKDERFFKLLMAFMREAVKLGIKETSDILKSKDQIGGYSLSCRQSAPGETRISIRHGHSKPLEFFSRKGAWLERLAAFALIAAGGKQPRVNLKAAWRDQVAPGPHENTEDMPHRLEHDVVGEFEGDYVLISCKSDPAQDIEKAAEEAEDTAVNLGHFALSMLAHYGSPKSCYDDRTVIIGWRELCQPKVLSETIRELRKKQSTTMQGG